MSRTPSSPEAAPRQRSPLRERPFALLWASGLVSDIGDWMLLIGLPVFVFALTGSALTTSTVFVAELVPAIVVGQIGGVLVDRLDRRRLLVAASLVQAVGLLPLLLVDSPDRLWIVYVVAAVQSGLARICGPAVSALVPATVEAASLAQANALTAVAGNVARLVGAPLGGLAIDQLGLRGIVVIDAVTFAVAALLVAGVRVPARATAADVPPTQGDPGAPDRRDSELPPGKPSFVADWLDGMRTIARVPVLRAAIAVGVASQVAQGIFVVLFVVFVLDVLHADGAAVGVIRGMQAVGGVVAGVVLARVAGRLATRTLVGGGFIAFGLISLVTWNAPALTTAIPVFVALFVIVGVPAVATFTGLQTAIQAAAPATHVGRVFAAFETGSGALQAVGVVAAGALTDRVGVLPILDVQASIYVACGLAALVLLRPAVPRHAVARAA
jgi:MFS family permease